MSLRLLAVWVTLGSLLASCAALEGDFVEESSASLELAVPGTYATIQSAVDAASSGDVVRVAAGDYTENVRLKTGVHLVGAGPERTILRGQILFNLSESIEISGFTVNADGASGLSIDAGIGCEAGSGDIHGNIVEGFGVGIALNVTSEVRIDSNIVRLNQVGIEFSENDSSVVSNNQILHNRRSGIVLYFDARPDIVHNTIVGNGFAESLNDGGSGVVVGPFNMSWIQNNIIVANNGGIFASESSSRRHHNLVWGNIADYVSSASAGTGDLSLDPRFMDPGNKDYRLQSDSPAINTGVDVSVVGDFSGNLRPTGGAPDLGAFEFQSVADTGDLVINEVMSNPLDEAVGEFVELFNPTGSPVDAAGLVIDDGDASDVLLAVGSSMVVPAGGFAVVVDQGYHAGLYDIPAEAILLTVPNAAIGSGLSTNDPIRIARGDAVVSSYVHPFNAGNGLAVERIDPEGPDQPDNWVTSPCGSSPGRPNCISFGGGPVGLPAIVISEVMASPADQVTGEFVELFNFGDETVELSGLVLTDGDSSDVLIAVAGKESALPAGQHGIIIDSGYISGMTGAPYYLDGAVPVVVSIGNAALGNGLSTSDPIAILASDGETAITTYSHPIATSEQSVERVDPLESDLTDNWIPSPCAERHSAGRPNCSYGGGGPVEVPNLIINEVMANPVDEDRDEFVEIYNPGNQPVDVAGLVLSDGDSTDVIEPFEGMGGSTTIPSGGYGVILDPEYLGEYAIADGTIWLVPDDTTLGNGLATTDPITLYATDGLTTVATFSFPFNPGNGISVERLGDTGDIESNWVASACSSGASPGALNCASGDVPDPDPDPQYLLVITEVMANPVDEAKGEFVEIVNLDSSSVDLVDFVLSDGDATDTIEAYPGGSTVIPAGGIGVILDRNYADFETAPYTIPGGAVLMTTDDNTIGSGLATDDLVTLLAADGTTSLATYGFPFNPGNGFSAERVDLAAADTAANWVVSSCDSGSSPGAANCSGGAPPANVVDVNTATQADLEQVGGIGPATASLIVSYRDNHGPYESLAQLTVNDGISADKVADWMVAEEGEPEYVIGLAGANEVRVFANVGELLALLPDPATPGVWSGAPVRIQRAVALDTADSDTQQDFTFADWGDDADYEPDCTYELDVFFDMAPGESSYDREQTNHANAMADWAKEDGDPYRNPYFYRWSEPLWSYGAIAYSHIYALEGVVEVEAGEWRLRIRGETDAGIDRVVLIERWLPADAWAALEVVWTYGYKSVVVEATSGYSYALPYRLALAHPARQYWFDEQGAWIEVPRCTSFGECGAMTADWNLFNEALAAWKEAPIIGDGYCFEYDSIDYCFSSEEEGVGIDILNNASFSQLTDHCYTSSLANVVVSNRPFGSIAGYDATSGVGGKSLWNLLICYVRSDDWPPADEGSVAAVLQGIPSNEYTTVTVDDADVTWRHATLNLFDICDPPDTDQCIKVYSTSAIPGTLSVDDEVRVRGEVRYYDSGDYWELMLNDAEHFVEILTDN